MPEQFRPRARGEQPPILTADVNQAISFDPVLAQGRSLKRLAAQRFHGVPPELGDPNIYNPRSARPMDSPSQVLLRAMLDDWRVDFRRGYAVHVVGEGVRSDVEDDLDDLRVVVASGLTAATSGSVT